MTTTTVAVQSATTHGEALLAGLPELVVWLRSQATEIENQKRLPAHVIERLHAVGLFKLTLPETHGGLGLTPDKAWKVIFDVARGSASAAWLISLCAANVVMLTRLSDRARSELFDGNRVVVSALTGAVPRNLVASPAEGGITLSGAWGYASGIDAANWVGVLVPLGNPARTFFALIPKSSFAIDHDSWNVLGMRGTGSKDVVLPATFIPDHRLTDWALLQQGGKHPDCTSSERLDTYPINALFAASILAPSLGVAHAIVDEFEAFMIRRLHNADPGHRDPHAMSYLAQARAAVTLACRALITEAEAPLATMGDEAPTLRMKAEMRVRIVMIARSAMEACQQLFSAAGGQILPTGAPFERLLRDFHAMYSHVLLQPEPISENCGRLQLGLEPLPNTRI